MGFENASAHSLGVENLMERGKKEMHSPIVRGIVSLIVVLAVMAVAAVTPVMAGSYTVNPLYNPNVAKNPGSTVPIKIQVLDETQANVSSLEISVTISGISCGAVKPAGKGNIGNAFRYDPLLGETGGYIYNLKVPKDAPKGACTVSITVGSNSYSLPFTVK
jgi:hypothetical protein